MKRNRLLSYDFLGLLFLTLGTLLVIYLITSTIKSVVKVKDYRRNADTTAVEIIFEGNWAGTIKEEDL